MRVASFRCLLACCGCAALAPAGSRLARRGDFRRAHHGSQTIQHAVYILMTVGRAEALPELDRLVDRHAVRDLLLVDELPRGDEQDRALDRAHLVPLAVDEGLEGFPEGCRFRERAAQLRLEERLVRRLELVELREVLQHLRRRLARVQPSVYPLERELARAPPRRSHPATAFSVFAISTATRAVSAPLTAARTRACSSASEVSTPFAMGTPVSSCTSRMPRALSLATI